MKLKAKSVEAGRYDLVLHPSHLWLTIHESVGHSTELDRALWWEANYAGTSFLRPEDAGKLKFGAPIVNFFADRMQPAGLATVGFDEEAVPAQRWYLVKNGIFVDWQTTRDLAPQVGRKTSYGCLHAESWDSVPFPRMPNVSLEAGTGNTSLDDLVGGIERGVLIMGDGSFSIDQQRYNFQFGGQTFWEIQKGKVAGMLRDVAYQSRTTDFWGACDGLGGAATYRLGGAFNDGKGEPTQLNAVSHGCPVARFRGINVLNTGVKADHEKPGTKTRKDSGTDLHAAHSGRSAADHRPPARDGQGGRRRGRRREPDELEPALRGKHACRRAAGSTRSPPARPSGSMGAAAPRRPPT